MTELMTGYMCLSELHYFLISVVFQKNWNWELEIKIVSNESW